MHALLDSAWLLEIVLFGQGVRGEIMSGIRVPIVQSLDTRTQ